MHSSKTRMTQRKHNRLSSNGSSHRSSSHSQKPSLNSNVKTERRASSASSPRTHIRSDDIIISLQQIMTINDLSDPIIKEQTTLTFPMEQITRECIICMIERPLNEFIGMYSDTCVHIERKVCNSCVYENTKCLVEDSIIYYGNITCPEENCHGIFDYNGIREILLFIGKNNALFEQYDQHLINLQLAQMPDFIWCAYGCGSGQLYDLGASANPAVTCGKCNRLTCSKHRVIWHTDMSCDQYDLLKDQPTENDANNKWLELFTKQCPQCQWHIQKYEGCDHMTCRYCQHEFCWQCFVNYKLIADKGQSQHKTSCSHYQPDPSTASVTTSTDQS